MLGIVNDVFSGNVLPCSAVMPCQFHSINISPSFNFLCDGNCLFPARRGQGSPADFQRMLSTSGTCPAPTEAERKLCRPLYSCHRLIPFTIPENDSVKIPAVLQIPCRKFLQKKSQFTIHFH